MTLDFAAASRVPRDLAHEIRRLRSVPDEMRDYTITTRDAEKQFGLTPPAVRTLLAGGLPHRGGQDDARLNAPDLIFLATRMGTAHAHLAAFAFIARSLEQFAASASTTLMVTCIPRLPRETPRAAGTVVLPHGDRREVELVHGEVAAEFAITLRARHIPTPSSLIDAVAEIGALDLYILPRPLVGDVLFARRTGLSECITAAHVLAECCGDAGYEARIAEGLMVAVPWSNPHCWCEVRVDEEWLALDPLMIRALRSFGALDADAWPAHRSASPMLAQFAPGAFPIVTRRDNGSRVEATFLTSVSQAGRPIRRHAQGPVTLDS